ncbi:hypothetical protein Sinac_1545 [Singulisphaera acidiphila DSM 18658]|uniref:Glycosyltransferase RgtA/B/C/D-like domain-containing protein n=2 Tax=Singulisphaera acidiphila TaxID=466153 RepID=L0D962_SINAD|nr:hypothetical protein [Singulisphaera acidiphila]AGA25924.1 hypothetical protein Sinac_1545 [Singulisphaera acidiphila DSM 18658]
MGMLRRPEAWVFVILLGSYAFFWHARDWNSASRLMLTYSIVDRGTVLLDGLDQQTGDIAKFHGRYYSDKLPGYSLLATLPYALAKTGLGLPPHPRNVAGLAYWPADYWTTLGTSGLFSALSGVLLTILARDLGCGPRRSLLVGLSYGLATPAYAYATMSHGHQATAFALLASFALLWREGQGRPALRAFFAGVLAAYAAVIELQVGPVSAILGFYLLALVLARKRKPARLGEFAVGASLPTLLLLGYNVLAFGSPWDMGYFHHATDAFQKVHSAENPLGLRGFAGAHVIPLLWGGYRGLFFYAPILIFAIPGWIVLANRREWGMAVVSAATALAIFLVNLSYPEWTGGWSTGPRLLVPLFPFAMLPVAATLAAGGVLTTWIAVGLALAGGVLMLLFQGIGAHVPQFIADPLLDVVLPLWSGADLPPWWVSGRFARNLVGLLMPGRLAQLPERWQGLQFAPLVVAQILAILGASRLTRRPPTLKGPADPRPGSNLGVDQE